MAKLPAALDLASASLSFSIPGDRRLQSVSVARLATSAERADTTVRFTLSEALLRVVFEPALVIHLPPPLSDLALQNITYELTTGAITSLIWHLNDVALHLGRDAATKAARDWMRNLVTSTPLAIPPYSPSADAEILSTIQGIFTNLQGGGGVEPLPIGLSEIREIAGAVRISFTEEILFEIGGGGVRIPAGTVAELIVELTGSLPEIQAAPRIRVAKLESSSVILRKDGVDQAKVKRFVLRPGGAITVEDVTALGDAGAAAGAESLIRLLGVLSTGDVSPDRLGEIAPDIVLGLVKSEIEGALGPAVRGLVETHRDTVPGLDLRELLGIS
jgi:hypothetical protein